jgi:competence protein ComEC
LADLLTLKTRIMAYGRHVISTSHSGLNTLEHALDSERDQLPYWIPVGLGAGIVCWERFGDGGAAIILFIASLLISSGILLGREKRVSALLKFAGITISIGFLSIMLKSFLFGAPPIENLQISEFYGRIISTEKIAARDIVRLKLQTDGHAGLPPIVRVNLTPLQYKSSFTRGAIVRMRARLVPPAQPALPGGYDFARKAWFSGIGATGTALGEVRLHSPSSNAPFLSTIRQGLSSHITQALPGPSGTIAAALATGDQGAISEDDAEAMRNSGMAHLLSISGLHVTAVVGALFFLVSRTAALSPYIALRIPVPIIAACVAAMGAVGYTLLTGSEVPTIRSCVAAILILAALILGRDAMSLRLVAFGATVILLFWPESLAGPSFQLSFAAVATIIILHETGPLLKISRNVQDNWFQSASRNILMLLITGIAIELVLAPIALFHFHKTGLYGALANIIAIPLTTFITMPAEALALLFDTIGIGAPFWWITGLSIDVILAMARYINALPGAVSMLPSMPNWAFAAMVSGALWAGLLQTRMRIAGLLPFAVGFLGMLSAPTPDILITGDGKHVAVTDGEGRIALLRDRAGDYVRNSFRESAGITAQPVDIEQWPQTRCTPDSCVIMMERGERRITILALRSRYRIPAMELIAACKRVDIVISERWLPVACAPRSLKADRRTLGKTGGIAVAIADLRVKTVAQQSPYSPWVIYAKQAAIKKDEAFKNTKKRMMKNGMIAINKPETAEITNKSD